MGEGVANYTDVLLILSAEDYARAQASVGEPWDATAIAKLSREFDNFCRRENFRRLHAHRKLGFRILCDGSNMMNDQNLGLQRGEPGAACVGGIEQVCRGQESSRLRLRPGDLDDEVLLAARRRDTELDQRSGFDGLARREADPPGCGCRRGVAVHGSAVLAIGDARVPGVAEEGSN